jgi:hypothetical protein
VTSTITKTLTLSQGSKDSSLMSKLISLSSQGKFSIIDSVVEKLSKGALGVSKPKSTSSISLINPEQQQEPKSTEEFVVVTKEETKVIEKSTNFEIIEEIDEEDALEEIKEIEEKAHGKGEEVVRQAR